MNNTSAAPMKIAEEECLNDLHPPKQNQFFP